MYKPSRFNFWAVAPNGSHLLYNGVSGALYELDDDEAPAWRASLAAGGAQVDSVVTQHLVDGGFLVNSERDEIEDARARSTAAMHRDDLLQVTISPTYQCNFRCTYCYVDFQPERMSDDAAARTLRHLAEQIPLRPYTHVTWFGGEPLLCINTVVDMAREITRIGTESKRVVRQFLTTNGYLLDAATAGRLVDAGVTFFHVTIDGPAECHDARDEFLRAVGRRTPRIMDNVISVLEIIPTAQFTLRMNLESDSIAEADALLRTIPERHRQRVQVHATPVIRGDARPAELLHQMIAELLGTALQLGFRYYDNVISPARPTYCSAEVNSTVQIGPDGRIHKCSPSGKPEVSIGTLDADGHRLLNANDNAWRSVPTLKATCPDCSFLCFCSGGCRLDRLRHSGDDRCPRPVHPDGAADREPVAQRHADNVSRHRSPVFRFVCAADRWPSAAPRPLKSSGSERDFSP